MAEACTCGQGVKNLGLPNCAPIFKVATRFWFSERISDAGALNTISLAGGVYDDAFFTALTNDTNPHERWYPTPVIENYVWTVADSEKETTSNGNTYVLRKGAVTVSFDLKDVPAMLANKFESMTCPKMQFVFVDKSGNLVGDTSQSYSDDILKGIPIQKGSFDVKYTPATDGMTSTLSISFIVPPEFAAGDLGFLAASAMTTDLNEVDGLLDVTGTVVGTPTTTGFVIDARLDYGTATEPIPFEGAVVGDFVLTEVSPTPGAIVITSVTPHATIDGRYTFVIPSQTSGDVLRLALSKTGFEMSPVTVTIP